MKLRILCVDDSRSVHAFLKECTSEVADSFQSVFEGEQAVEFIKKNKENIDLIFLDWEMPKKNGPEVLEEIRKMNFMSPVIMLTSKNLVSDIMNVLSKGASEYIMKPFTKEIILEKISLVMVERSRG